MNERCYPSLKKKNILGPRRFLPNLLIEVAAVKTRDTQSLEIPFTVLELLLPITTFHRCKL